MNISLAFFVLGSLLLWFIIGSKGGWSLKALVIALVLYSCLSINISLDDLFGWPSGQSLPESFRVHWIEIKEPNKRTGEKGSIYTWVTNTGDHDKKSQDGWRSLFVSLQNYDPTEPRSYRLPYSKELHKTSQEALNKLKKGGMVGGKSRGKGGGKGKGKSKGQKGRGGKGKGEGKGGGSLSNSNDIIFHDLPPSRLPDKVTE
jgi:hypothetical protein